MTDDTNTDDLPADESTPDTDVKVAEASDAPDPAAAEASDPTAEAATDDGDDAATGAGLSNEWTGGVAEDSRATAAAGTEEVLDEDALLADDEVEPYVSPYDRPGRWFVLHTQSGYEKKVKQNLEARTASMNMEDRIHEVVIPTREVPEFKNGKKVMTEKKLFPGYLLCRASLNDDAWYVIRNTPGVTGFVNQGGKPSPMRRKDVENFLGVEADRTQEQTKKAKPMFEYELGETVRVKEGPFADFSGEIIEINEDQLRVKVLVNIFGRETPVELEFAQVARL
jgi:transcriptional antiterminator NusG